MECQLIAAGMREIPPTAFTPFLMAVILANTEIAISGDVWLPIGITTWPCTVSSALYLRSIMVLSNHLIKPSSANLRSTYRA